ncbi:MAG: FapA family protein [Bacillota bacterium]
MTQTEKDGLIGIINGKFKIVDPEEGGKRAVLIPPEEGATIYVNGLELETPVTCESHDVITIEPTAYMEDSRIEVKISPDGLYALAAVFPRIITSYQLQDAPLTHSLKPQFTKWEIFEKTLTLEEAEQELRKNNIVTGISFAALKELVQNADGEFKTVAWGRAMEEGIDGHLEFIISPEVEVISYENEDKRADFREKYRYPAVKQGDVIAVLHPPQEGKPGQKVTGEAIIPKPVKGAKVRCGEGAALAQNQKDIVALKDGRLIVTGNNIKVVNLLLHNGDVNLESGNLRFTGDIRIFGNVMEGMLVEARGSLSVEGSCYGAVLKAGGGIKVSKNIIKSEVQGGLFYTLLREVFILVGQLAEELETFINNLNQVLKGLAGKGQEIDDEYLKRIIKMLLDKSSGLQDNLIMLIRRLENSDYTYLDNTLNALKKLEDILSLKAQKYDPEDFVKLLKTFNALLKEYYEVLREVPPLTASYVQNCKIQHSGDIEISGAGCYFSTLQSGGEVRVTGVYRGGSIRAEGNVKVKEFICITTTAEGLDKKSMIRVKVPERAAVYFDLVHEDTTVQIGKMVYRFDRDYSKIKINYDPQEGMLKLTNF